MTLYIQIDGVVKRDMLNRFDNFQVIDLSELDLDDRTYAISPPWFPLGLLANSIKKTGIVNPLHVEAGNGNRYRIICGFRRAQAAGAAGIKSLPCWVRGNSAPADLFIEAVLDNAGSRSLHELEKAAAVNKLTGNFKISEQRMVEEFLPLLEIRPTSFHLRRYLEIDHLPEPLKKATVETRLEMETALVLRGWTSEEQSLFLNLQRRHGLNVNTQKKLAEVLDELRRKSGLSPIEIWTQATAGKSALSPVEGPPGDGPSPAGGDTESEPAATAEKEFESAFHSLLRLRMPRLSRLEERYRELKSALRLPPEIRVQPPPYFEGERMTISFSASSAQEFRQAAERLQSAARTTEMDKIFELL